MDSIFVTPGILTLFILEDALGDWTVGFIQIGEICLPTRSYLSSLIASRIPQGRNAFDFACFPLLDLLQALPILRDLQLIKLYRLPLVRALNTSLFVIAILNIVTNDNLPGKRLLHLDVLSRVLFLASLLFQDAFRDRTVYLISTVEEVRISS